jgi:hypothetical protein
MKDQTAATTGTHHTQRSSRRRREGDIGGTIVAPRHKRFSDGGGVQVFGALRWIYDHRDDGTHKTNGGSRLFTVDLAQTLISGVPVMLLNIEMKLDL